MPPLPALVTFGAFAALAALATAAPAALHAQTVYRCGNSYGTQACPQGRALQIPATPAPASIQTVYLCKAWSGGRFWSAQACQAQKATVERMVPVPAHLPWENQLALAQAAHTQGQSLARTGQRAPQHPAPQRAAPTTQNQTSHNTAACLSLRQSLQNLDSAARAGGTAKHMEWLANQRRAILAEMSRIRCA